MKRFSLLASVGAAVLLFATAAHAELRCEQPAVQTGEVHSGAPLAHRFALINSGTETIEILDVKPSCGCMAPKVNQRVFAPGARGALLLEINTLTQDAGLQSWRVTVRYREGHEEHELSLQMAATVVTQISVTPPSLVLYTTSAIEHEIALTDRRQTPMTVTAVQASSPHLRTRLGDWQRNDEGHSVRTIAVEVLPDFPEGRREETLQVFTSDPEYRELRIPVTVVKRPRQTVSASPDSLAVSTAADEPIPSRIVMLRSADDQPVVVERVECDDAAVTCTTAAGPGLRATLKVQIDRAKVKGDALEAKVRVMLKQPAGQTITVPLIWSQR
jgi:hypothetical protein